MWTEVLMLLAILAQSAEPMRVEQLGWLAGCWSDARDGREVEEQWTAPRGGTMLGLSRTVKGGRTVAWEQMRIEEKDGRLVFTAHPSGQAETSFTATELTATSVTFANPGHDFPQRVIYRREGEGKVMGRIEGERGGKAVGIDFPLAPAACPVSERPGGR